MFERRLDYFRPKQIVRHIRFGLVEVVEVLRESISLRMQNGDLFRVSWDAALSVLQPVNPASNDNGLQSFNNQLPQAKSDFGAVSKQTDVPRDESENTNTLAPEFLREPHAFFDYPPSIPTFRFKEQVRPYQTEALRALTDSLKLHDNVLLALPTGSGKTFVAAKWLVDHVINRDGRVVWVAHRIELLDQAYLTFARLLPPDLSTQISWWSGSRPKNPYGRVLLVSIAATRVLPKIDADYLVIDEAHHEPAPTYQRLKELLTYKKHIGLTATPERLDQKTLGYSTIAYQRSFFSLVEEGWLARPKAILPKTGMSFELEKQMDDFADESLKKLDSDSRNQLIVNHWIENIDKYAKTLVFAINRAHAKRLTQLFRNSCPQKNTECIISGEKSENDRDAVVQKFRNGKIDILVNCKIFTEGLDIPDVKTILLTRPTLSATLYLQMVGRGTRITPSKNNFYLVDFQDDLGKFQDKLIGSWILNDKDPLVSVPSEDPAEQTERRRSIDIPAWVSEIVEKAEWEINDVAGYVEYQPLGKEVTGFIVHANDEFKFLSIWNMIPGKDTPDKSVSPHPLKIMEMIFESGLTRINADNMIPACFAKTDDRARYVSLGETLPPNIMDFLSDVNLSATDRDSLLTEVSRISAIMKFAPDEIEPDLEFCLIFKADEEIFRTVMEDLKKAVDLEDWKDATQFKTVIILTWMTHPLLLMSGNVLP